MIEYIPEGIISDSIKLYQVQGRVGLTHDKFSIKIEINGWKMHANKRMAIGRESSNRNKQHKKERKE